MRKMYLFVEVVSPVLVSASCKSYMEADGYLKDQELLRFLRFLGILSRLLGHSLALMFLQLVGLELLASSSSVVEACPSWRCFKLLLLLLELAFDPLLLSLWCLHMAERVEVVVLGLPL